MKDIILEDSKFNPDPFWHIALKCKNPIPYWVPDLFDQNGYDMCYVEQMYGKTNHYEGSKHRPHRVALRKPWMTQQYKNEGAVLNHSLLFERKGYSGDALEQLKSWAKKYPAYYKLINIKPKWGLDFSIDYYDMEGNTFEILHWEYDGFSHDEINEKKQSVEVVLQNIDWDDAAKDILMLKHEWYGLDFFKQSDYKCNYFGIGQERWKMVVWS